MFLLREPPEGEIRRFIGEQRDAPFSYREVGGTRGGAPSGYTVDRNRASLGEGEGCFLRAVEAVESWKMFDIGWVRLCWPDAPIEAGTVVAVLGRHYGFWSLNACRIVYRIDEEDGDLRRFGFAYGTLPEHAERGEERFTVEWDRRSGSVHYEILAFSKQNYFPARLGYPLARGLQRRFAEDSKRAMARAVGPG